MVSIILIFYLLIVMIQYLSTSQGLRESIINAYLLIFGFTVILTEVLSLADLITRQGVLVAWLIPTGLTLIWMFFKFKGKEWRKQLQEVLEWIRKLSWIDRLIIFCIIFILIFTLIIAIKSPPNNFDSMTYHMARVANWIQNKSIKFYPTSIPRQNYSMPLAEYMILHLQLISQSDQFANLIQWSGFVIVILTASEVAKQLHVSRSGQLIAAFFTATLPMAILQSTSTQNDLITGLFCLIFAYYLFKTINSLKLSDILYAGLSLGLALLTKGTAYVYCGVIGLAIGGYGIFKKNPAIRLKLIRVFGLIIICALILNSGIYFRNIDLYSHPLSTATERITNDKLSIKVLYANLVRNGTMQLAVPFPKVNEIFTSRVITHLGDSASNPDSTFQGTRFQIQYLINEDEAGNLLHFVLILIVILLLPWIKASHKEPLYLYAGVVTISTVMFSLLFKWQPWGNRLQLPLFFLGSPLVGYIKDRVKGSYFLILLGIFSFSCYSVPYVMLNSTRPLVPIFKKESPFRTHQINIFFSNRPHLYDEYAEIIAPFYNNRSVLRTDRQIMYFSSNMSFYEDYQQVMNAVKDLEKDLIGLHLGNNDWEYPIWVLANRNASVGSPHFKHVAVEDISLRLDPEIESLPEYIISTRLLNNESTLSKEYQIVVDTPSITLLRR